VSLRYLLDTNVLSEPIRKRYDVGLVARVGHHTPESATAAPVWHELVHGCERLPPSRRRTRLEEYVRGVVPASFPILPYDEAAAAWHAAERARLEAEGRPPPVVDGQIAAIAVVHELVLVTANVQDFDCFEDLSLEDWRTTR